MAIKIPCPNFFDTAKATQRDVYSFKYIDQEIKEVKSHKLKLQLKKLEK